MFECFETVASRWIINIEIKVLNNLTAFKEHLKVFKRFKKKKNPSVIDPSSFGVQWSLSNETEARSNAKMQLRSLDLFNGRNKKKKKRHFKITNAGIQSHVPVSVSLAVGGRIPAGQTLDAYLIIPTFHPCGFALVSIYYTSCLKFRHCRWLWQRTSSCSCWIDG